MRNSSLTAIIAAWKITESRRFVFEIGNACYVATEEGTIHSYCYLGLCVKLSLDFFIPCSMQSLAGETNLSNFDPVQVILGGGLGRAPNCIAVEDPPVSKSRLLS